MDRSSETIFTKDSEHNDRNDRNDCNDNYDPRNNFGSRVPQYLLEKPFNRQCILSLLSRADNNTTISANEMDNVINLCNDDYVRNYTQSYRQNEGFGTGESIVGSLITLIIIVVLIVVLCWLLRAV
jgi:hypothetical protein